MRNSLNLSVGACVNIGWEEALRIIEKISKIPDATFSERDLETLVQLTDRVRESINLHGTAMGAYASTKDVEDMAIAQLEREGKLEVG